MFKYIKSLEYPVNIKKKDLKMAKYIISQYGGTYCKRDKLEKEATDICVGNLLNVFICNF